MRAVGDRRSCGGRLHQQRKTSARGIECAHAQRAQVCGRGGQGRIVQGSKIEHVTDPYAKAGDRIGSMQMIVIWIYGVQLMPVTQSLPRLICLPYAGGSWHAFAPWQVALQGQLEVVAPELPGRGHRIAEAPFSRLPALVDWLLDELDAQLADDFSLWGHSMGALLAYETARTLERRGRRGPRHLFVTGALPPRYPRHAERYHLLDDDGLIAKLAAMGGTPEEVLRDRDLMQIVLPFVRADFAVCETYAWDCREPAVCAPITAIGGDRDPDIAIEKLQGWNDCSRAGARVSSLPGGHFFLRDHVAALADTFTRTLARPALREPA
ncbi:thioesterase II family protein [Lysobacter enzymogenes]|uniref:thioesterase II family protein n=1 Tax=Lysobacter enzymogenes TaxID=69 RepID=UPI0018E932CF|nr:alpha/beta fold hydrolase [Lysobacter enzymogenes]UZW58436.1 alpha/beta fold hydrolase [Lysobacter enzymogenes]